MNFLLFYYSGSGGGAERIISVLSDYLVSSGDNVSVCFLEDKKIEYSINPNVEILYLKNNRKRVFANFLKRKSIDVILSFSFKLTCYARYLSFPNKISIVGSERGAVRKDRLVGKNRLFFELLPFCCNGYIFLTEKGRAVYPQRMQKKSVVINNPACIYFKEKSLFGNNGHFLTISRLDANKDVITIIKAFAIARAHYPKITLDIFGDGPEKENLQKLANELDVSSGVIFHGFQQNIYEKLDTYCAFLFASKSEGMPNVLLEALSAGLPCISSNCDFGPSEIIQNGDNGFLIDVGDYKKMADYMIFMLENKAELEIMSKNAKQILLSHDPNLVFNRYREYLLSFLKE